jgi:hypothetical protein
MYYDKMSSLRILFEGGYSHHHQDASVNEFLRTIDKHFYDGNVTRLAVLEYGMSSS